MLEPMRIAAIVAATFLLMAARSEAGGAPEAAPVGDPALRVVLLGTAGGPTIQAQRQGISTLVLAGPEKLLFDCGRGETTSMARLSINASTVTKVFLTHLHSDHVISLPELWLCSRPEPAWSKPGCTLTTPNFRSSTSRWAAIIQMKLMLCPGAATFG